jgi:hypothetical protein
MAMPVRGPVTLTGYVQDGEDDPNNSRQVDADENIVKNHMHRLSPRFPEASGHYDYRKRLVARSRISAPALPYQKLVNSLRMSNVDENRDFRAGRIHESVTKLSYRRT